MFTLAGGNDVIGVFLNVPVETLTMVFRVLLLVLPVSVWLLIYWLASSRREASVGSAPRGTAAGIALRRTADGGFEEAADGEDSGVEVVEDRGRLGE